ncbi:MAG TPA: hypothetical protein VN519_11595 [Bryobacteraceae bacterium]|nr:hypothetical protein [Bryobacteraceae bacterium]
MAHPSAIALLAATLLALPAAAQQKYTGAPPPKKNVPYLVQADNLIETEVQKAAEQKKKDDTIYTIPGDKSTARTPLASPMLVIDADGLDATKLQLFHLEVKNGHREITFKKKGKGGAMPLNIEVAKVRGTLFQIRVLDGLDPGEYSLSPDGSNDAFCFEVF